MRYGNRSRWKQVVGSPLAIVGLLVIFGILAKASWGIYAKERASQVRLSEAQSDYQKLEAQDQNLSNQVGYLSTEQGIAAQMRTQFHAAKPGESVAVILGDDQSADAVDASSTVSVPSSGWWQKLMGMIGL